PVQRPRDRRPLGLHRRAALQPHLPQRIRPAARRVPQGELGCRSADRIAPAAQASRGSLGSPNFMCRYDLVGSNWETPAHAMLDVSMESVADIGGPERSLTTAAKGSATAGCRWTVSAPLSAEPP